MLVLVPVTPENALVLKEVRLRALQDTPSAFCSTYAEESQLSDDDWAERSIKWNSDGSVTYLAVDDGIYCGIAASRIDQRQPQRAHLLSMWVAPERRRTGTGRMLVQAVERWAVQHGTQTLCLMVTSRNDRAIAFYRSLGFSMTGNTAPYPNDPSLIEYEMSKQLP